MIIYKGHNVSKSWIPYGCICAETDNIKFVESSVGQYIKHMETVMNNLDYLGGALENFYKDGIINSHLTPVIITVKENEKTLAHGTAFEIKENLKDKYTRKILKWDFTYYKWEIFCNV